MSSEIQRRRKGVALAVLLRHHFGRKWPLWLLVITAITIAPIAWFWNDVGLAPDKFVEEWTKMIVSTLLVAIVVEFIVGRRQREEAAEETRGGLRRDYLLPLDRIIHSLQLLAAMSEIDLDVQDRLSSSIHREWQELRERHRRQFILAAPALLEEEDLATIRALDIARMQRLLESALSAQLQQRNTSCMNAIAALQLTRKAFSNAEDTAD